MINAKKLIKKLGLMPPNKLDPIKLATYFDNRKWAACLPLRLAGHWAVGRHKGVLGHSIQEGQQARVAIIGKGMTFDSGGISIKPSHNMHHMKFDMLGAATVLGLKENLKGVKGLPTIDYYGCCAENTFYSNTYRPGDVIDYADGTRVEVINTDAEGRLVLADGIIEAKKESPDLIITIATLTGSAKAALGDGATAVFGNNDDLVEEFLKAAAQCGELAWRLPIWDMHRKDIKHKIKVVADIKNQGTMAGASTAAAFLEHFVGPDIDWIHLDIAGSAYKDEQPTCAMLDTLTLFLKDYL